MGIFDDMLGYGELAVGGFTALGAAYLTAQSVANGGGVFSTAIPLAVSAAGGLLALDGADRSGVWEWKKKYQLNWDDVMYGYVIGGTEIAGGAYLLYLAIRDLSASTETYQYKGLGYAIGITFAAGGSYLIYDGYRRIKPLSGGHIVRSDTETLIDPQDKSLNIKTLRFYFNDPDNENKPSYMKGENYKKQCEGYSGGRWIEGKLVLGKDTAADNGICVDDDSYTRYQAAIKAKSDSQKKGAEDAAADISNEQDKKDQKLRDIFNKPVKELTCAEWFEVNAVPNTWSEKARADFWSRNPKDCRDANDSGQSLNFVPIQKQDQDEQHYLDSTHWYVKDWSFLGWLRYQISGGGAGTGELRDYNYNSKKITANQMRTLVPGTTTAEPIDINKSLSELGYNEDLLKERFSGRARDPYSSGKLNIRDVDVQGKKDKSKENYKVAMSKYASGNKPAKTSVSVKSN